MCKSGEPLAAEACLFGEKWIVTWIEQNTRVILFIILKWNVNELCSHRRDISIHDLVPCHNSKSTWKFLECKGIPILEWPENRPDINPIQNVWNITKKEIGNLKLCKKKKICGSGYVKLDKVQHHKSWKKFYNSMPRRIADLIKAKGDATKYWLWYRCTMLLCFHGNVYKVCCCAFIGMHLKYVVFFIGIYFEFIFKCCLIIRWYDL